MRDWHDFQSKLRKVGAPRKFVMRERQAFWRGAIMNYDSESPADACPKESGNYARLQALALTLAHPEAVNARCVFAEACRPRKNGSKCGSMPYDMYADKVVRDPVALSTGEFVYEPDYSRHKYPRPRVESSRARFLSVGLRALRGQRTDRLGETTPVLARSRDSATTVSARRCLFRPVLATAHRPSRRDDACFGPFSRRRTAGGVLFADRPAPARRASFLRRYVLNLPGSTFGGYSRNLQCENPLCVPLIRVRARGPLIFTQATSTTCGPSAPS